MPSSSEWRWSTRFRIADPRRPTNGSHTANSVVGSCAKGGRAGFTRAPRQEVLERVSPGSPDIGCKESTAMERSATAQAEGEAQETQREKEEDEGKAEAENESS